MQEGTSRAGPRKRLILWGSLLGALIAAAGVGYRLGLEEWCIRQLASPDAAVRARAAERLADMDSGRAIPVLVRAIAVRDGSEDSDDTPALEAALERIVGPEDRSRLHELTRDPNPEVRGQAASLLGGLPPEPETFERLITLVKEPSKERVNDPRIGAIESLGSYGRRAAPALQMQIDPTASQDLDGSAALLAAWFLSGIGRNAKEAMPSLLEHYMNRKGDDTFAKITGLSYERVDSEVSRAILVDLRSGDDGARTRGFELLCDSAIEDADVVELVVEALEDPSERIRVCAARGLFSVATRFPARIRAALERKVLNPQSEVAVWVALGLHAMRPDDVGSVKVLLEHRDEGLLQAGSNSWVDEYRSSVRPLLEDVLFDLARDHQALLEATLKGADAYASVRAANALLRFSAGHTGAQAALLRHRESNDALVRLEVVRALVGVEPLAGWTRGMFDGFLDNFPQPQEQDTVSSLVSLAKANVLEGSFEALLDSSTRMDLSCLFEAAPLVAIHPAHVPALECHLASN